jgi:hypothetical protein
MNEEELLQVPAERRCSIYQMILPQNPDDHHSVYRM